MTPEQEKIVMQHVGSELLIKVIMHPNACRDINKTKKDIGTIYNASPEQVEAMIAYIASAQERV